MSKKVNVEQSENIYVILLTFEVSNVLNCNWVKLLHFSNIDIIEVTWDVSKWEIFNFFILWQLENI